MGKLNIAHHKSYHPYRRDNIERVRQDEEQARLEEATKEGKIMVADAESRIALLRQKADISSHPQTSTRGGPTNADAGPSSLISGGHINLFEDLESHELKSATMRTPAKRTAATDQGVPLAPSEKDRNPWYSDKDHERNREVDPNRKVREMARKSAHDPLTSINQELARRSGDTSAPRIQPPGRRPPPPIDSMQQPAVSERLNRESAERQRALELKRRRQRELAGSETPGTMRGDVDYEEYGDMYNRREVEDAHRHRDRRRHIEDRTWRNSR